MLDQYSYEAFHTTERCPVNHYWPVWSIVLTDIFQFETLRQVVVHLDGTQLPLTSNRILDHKVKLRSVEGCFAQFYNCVKTFFLTCLDNGILGLFPVFIRTNILFLVVGIPQ